MPEAHVRTKELVQCYYPQFHPDCHPDCVIRELGEQSGYSKKVPYVGSTNINNSPNQVFDKSGNKYYPAYPHDDEGTAARYFPQFQYCSKASKSERNEACINNHPCCKPIKLLEWLVKLACPEGGMILDPFMGSGSTGVATLKNNREFIGIELEPQWLDVARQRCQAEDRGR